MNRNQKSLEDKRVRLGGANTFVQKLSPYPFDVVEYPDNTMLLCGQDYGETHDVSVAISCLSIRGSIATGMTWWQRLSNLLINVAAHLLTRKETMTDKTRRMIWIVALFAVALPIQLIVAGILPSGFGKTMEAGGDCIGCHPGRHMATPAPMMQIQRAPEPAMQIQRAPAPRPIASPAVRPTGMQHKETGIKGTVGGK